MLDFLLVIFRNENKIISNTINVKEGGKKTTSILIQVPMLFLIFTQQNALICNGKIPQPRWRCNRKEGQKHLYPQMILNYLKSVMRSGLKLDLEMQMYFIHLKKPNRQHLILESAHYEIVSS